MSKEEKPTWLKVNADGSVTVTLSRPIEIDGANVSALTMREPTVDDQLIAAEVKGSEAIREVAFFANLCTVAPDDIKKLPVRNYARLQAAYAGFID